MAKEIKLTNNTKKYAKKNTKKFTKNLTIGEALKMHDGVEAVLTGFGMHCFTCPFSLMETLAIAVSDNANAIAAAIRAKLIDDSEKPKAKPIVDANAGADLFVTLPCASYIVTECESPDAIENAKQNLIKRMSDFDYENQNC